MARKKQPLKRTPSASGSGAASPTSATSPSAQTVNLPGSATIADRETGPAITPNDYFTSDKGDYRMPKITEPLAYLTVLWRRYEATFAISMFETVRDRAHNMDSVGVACNCLQFRLTRCMIGFTVGERSTAYVCGVNTDNRWATINPSSVGFGTLLILYDHDRLDASSPFLRHLLGFYIIPS